MFQTKKVYAFSKKIKRQQLLGHFTKNNRIGSGNLGTEDEQPSSQTVSAGTCHPPVKNCDSEE